MDFGKKLYEEKKQKAEAKKRQHQVQIKEMKFRPGTDDGDYQIKLRNLKRFLEDGDKAKVSLRFRGREMAHTEIGEQLLIRFGEGCAEAANMEKKPKLDGRNMSIFLSPKNAK